MTENGAHALGFENLGPKLQGTELYRQSAWKMELQPLTTIILA